MTAIGIYPKRIVTKAVEKAIGHEIRPKRREDREILENVTHAISIANAMNQCLWLGDKNHKGIYVNPVYEKTSGYSLKECVGKPADFCFDKEGKEIIAKHHGLRVNGQASQYETTMITKSGKKVPLLVSGAPTAAGGSIGIFINLTEIKKLDQQKRISEQIIRNSAEAIVVMDQKRKIKLWNAGAEKMFGYKEKEVINKSVMELLVPEDEMETTRKIIEKVDRDNVLKNFETKRLTKRGDIVDVSLSVTKVTDNDGKFIGYLVIYRDITQQKKVNTELQKRFEAIQDAYKELGFQKRQNDYLYEIINSGVEKSSLDSLARLIVSAACMLTRCDAAVLRMHDKMKDNLILKACLGVSDKWMDKRKISLENSLAKDAFDNKRPIIIHDIASSEKHKGTKLIKMHGFKTLVLLPLFIEDELVGSLSLYATDPGKFRLIETEFLEIFAKHCSTALYIKTCKK